MKTVLRLVFLTPNATNRLFGPRKWPMQQLGKDRNHRQNPGHGHAASFYSKIGKLQSRRSQIP